MKSSLSEFEMLDARIRELYNFTQEFFKKQECIINSIFEEALELKNKHEEEMTAIERNLYDMSKELERVNSDLNASNQEVKNLREELDDPIRQLVRRAKISCE